MNHRFPAQYHQPTDPDPRFTTRGGNSVTYYRPWDYLLVAILFIALTVGLTGVVLWQMATDPAFRHPVVLMLWALVLIFAAIGWWAMRKFVLWRRARIEWAHLTGTAYRGIFVLSSQIAQRRIMRQRARVERRAQQQKWREQRAQRRASSRSRRS